MEVDVSYVKRFDLFRNGISGIAESFKVLLSVIASTAIDGFSGRVFTIFAVKLLSVAGSLTAN